MITSTEIGELAKALAAAQGQIKNPTKGSINPHFKSRYSDLADGIDAIRDALAVNSIAVLQSTYMDGDLMMLETLLVHASGQWISSIYPVVKFPAQQQVIGSALTYARRYSLFALVGIAGDDDDGNEASKVVTPSPAKKQLPKPELNHDQSLYIKSSIYALSLYEDAMELRGWWKDEEANRLNIGIEQGSEAYATLRKACEDKGRELATKQKEAA